MVMLLSFIEEIIVIQTIYFFTYRNPIIPNYYSRSKYNKVDVFIIFIQCPNYYSRSKYNKVDVFIIFIQ
jgi:hypothetical protein